MSHPYELSGCACCSVNRRGFLAGCARLRRRDADSHGRQRAVAAEPKKKRVRVLYSLHADVQPGPDWPNVGFDFNPVMKRMTAALEAGCPEIEFIPTTATGRERGQGDPRRRQGRQDRRLPGRADELLESRRADGGRLGQAGAVRRFPLRRKRRLPRLHGRVPPPAGAELRLHQLVAIRRRGRGGQVLPRPPTSPRRSARRWPRCDWPEPGRPATRTASRTSSRLAFAFRVEGEDEEVEDSHRRRRGLGRPQAGHRAARRARSRRSPMPS